MLVLEHLHEVSRRNAPVFLARLGVAALAPVAERLGDRGEARRLLSRTDEVRVEIGYELASWPLAPVGAHVLGRVRGKGGALGLRTGLFPGIVRPAHDDLLLRKLAGSALHPFEFLDEFGYCGHIGVKNRLPG